MKLKFFRRKHRKLLPKPRDRLLEADWRMHREAMALERKRSEKRVYEV